MCRTWDPNRRPVTANLALLGTAAASPLDRAALEVLTERAREDGDSLHPDDVMAAPRRTVGMMRLNAARTGLELFDAPACDWCDQPAAVRVTDLDSPSHPDLACDFHLGYWFAKPIAAGERLDVARLNHTHR